MTVLRGLAIASGLLAASISLAGEWDRSGFAALDTRTFWQEPRFAGQSADVDLSFTVQPEAHWRSRDGSQRAGFVAFARGESNDSERTHFDLREAHWSFEASDWDLTVGINKVFWGVTESRHLVDVVNQTDLVEDIDGEEKLGQPMVNVNLQRDFGRFELFVLPYFRERTFAGHEGRLRAPLPVDTGDPIYESSHEERHVDYALRYSHYIGDLDIGLSLFDGTSREPSFEPSPRGDRLRPRYGQVTQVGVDLQYTRDAWLWKLEGIARGATGDSFIAAVGGFEYTFYGVRDSAADVGALVEILYDGRGASAPPTVFDNDLFVGSRLALNDAADTSLLAGVAVDANTHEVFFNVEAERRLRSDLVGEFRMRAFANAEPNEASYSFERDDYVEVSLRWYY